MKLTFSDLFDLLIYVIRFLDAQWPQQSSYPCNEALFLIFEELNGHIHLFVNLHSKFNLNLVR